MIGSRRENSAAVDGWDFVRCIPITNQVSWWIPARACSLHAVLSTPVDRTGACRFLPCSRGLPRLTGGSASTTSLSEPAQASLALRPARSQPAQGGLLSRGFGPASYPTEPLGSYHVLPTTTWMDPPSTGDLRRWGAL